MRGATRTSSARPSATSNFNPRSSCEERRVGSPRKIIQKLFQSTLLMRGATCASTCSASPIRVFQSTLLMRGATKSSRAACRALKISIHAPHARSDKLIVGAPAAFSIFQSTLLMRGATVTTADIEAAIKISIHAPHARSDYIMSFFGHIVRYFNPRSSCEERPDGA